MDELTILALSVRILIALCTRTYFQPDEYFQSLEPAHHIVFGYGYLTWEWLAPQPIRSILYPALNVPIYTLLKITGLHNAGALGEWLMIISPKIMHGAFAACTDIFLSEITRKTIGPVYVPAAVFFSLTSFFHALSLSRSLSNSLETALTTIAFAQYPWDASPNISIQLIYNRFNLRKCILFSALACMIRPTNAVIWVFLYANLLWAVKQNSFVLRRVLLDILLIGSAAVTFLFAIDSAYYGKPTFTPLNFLRTNLSSVSSFYGTNAWYSYLLQTVPILCTTALPFTIDGIWVTITRSSTRDTPLRTMLMTLAWTITIFSFGSHKEWRFLHPILPLFHIFAAKSILDRSTRLQKISTKSNPSNTPFSPITTLAYRCGLQGIKQRYLVFTLLTLPASFFVVLVYGSAPISVLGFLRNIPAEELGPSTVGFLMPCHSTPGFAYLHRKALTRAGSWALGCEPPLQHQYPSEYKDQTDIFYDSPQEYLEMYFPKSVNPSFPPSPLPTSIVGKPAPEPMLSSEQGRLRHPWQHEWPKYLVFFGHLLWQEGVQDILEDNGYREVWKGGREFEGDEKRKGGVRVWKWHSTIEDA
ncbi:glycosyltransferase family 22 protein [Crepidotus variabilis]|uniref:Mannosyltransferase n=1 Tax=Crepidotus variabilis TaxID=179855 RepID=A0A9P6ED80_9AGAR|nr:glycosyltransferase family 22 protein [Crepidotus variabilis]